MRRDTPHAHAISAPAAGCDTLTRRWIARVAWIQDGRLDASSGRHQRYEANALAAVDATTQQMPSTPHSATHSSLTSGVVLAVQVIVLPDAPRRGVVLKGDVVVVEVDRDKACTRAHARRMHVRRVMETRSPCGAIMTRSTRSTSMPMQQMPIDACMTCSCALTQILQRLCVEEAASHTDDHGVRL